MQYRYYYVIYFLRAYQLIGYMNLKVSFLFCIELFMEC